MILFDDLPKLNSLRGRGKGGWILWHLAQCLAINQQRWKEKQKHKRCVLGFLIHWYPHGSRALSYLFASVPFLNSLLYRKILNCIKSVKERGLEGRVNSSSSGTKNIKKEKSNDFNLRFFLAGLRGRGCAEAPPFPSPPPPALGSPPRRRPPSSGSSSRQP